MGPPGFNSQIRPFGRFAWITQKAGAAQAIIDGPSLAHEICKHYSQHWAKGDILINSELSKIGEAVVTWLDDIQLYGFEIEGIYFDGALPPYKRAERLDRMQKKVDAIVKYKMVHDQYSRQTPNATSDVTKSEVKRAKKGLPAHPFMVFAVVEALFASQYAQKTWLVDGEADGFCAAAAAQAALKQPNDGIVIFTSDSDLVMFDFRAPVKITLLGETEVEDDEERRIKLWVIDGNDTVVNGSKPDLVEVGYLMQHWSTGLLAAISHTGSAMYDQAKYQAYREIYNIERWTAKLHAMKAARLAGTDALKLDSRVSEPIQQAKAILATIDTDFDATPTEELNMYLPNLLDDPVRSDPWKIGVSFRRIAQMLILLASPAPALLEYRRSATVIMPTSVQKASVDKINCQLEALSWQLTALTTTAPLLDEHDAARFYIMQMAAQDMAEQNLPLPAYLPIREVLAGKPHTIWNIVHLSAQFQAQYYSCKILQQVRQWWMSEHREHDVSWPKEVVALLDELPGIGEFFHHGGLREDSTWDQWRESIAELRGRLGAREPTPAPHPVPGKTKAPGNPRMANNPFAKLMCPDV